MFNHTFSEQYEMVVNDVFSILKEIGFEKLKDLSSEQKNEIIYRPITAAIISEINDICGCNEDAVPYFMSQMIPGEDYYELRLGNKYDPFIKITAFNFKNTIGNKKLKQINLPTILQKVKMKESVTGRPSLTTIEIFMDNNWTAEFRFHANLISTKSFNIAMDIRLTSVPHDIESFIVELK